MEIIVFIILQLFSKTLADLSCFGHVTRLEQPREWKYLMDYN